MPQTSHKENTEKDIRKINFVLNICVSLSLLSGIYQFLAYKQLFTFTKLILGMKVYIQCQRFFTNRPEITKRTVFSG